MITESRTATHPICFELKTWILEGIARTPKDGEVIEIDMTKRSSFEKSMTVRWVDGDFFLLGTVNR